MAADLVWYDMGKKEDFEKFVNVLCKGDLVEFERHAGYSHWAVCVSAYGPWGYEPEFVHRTGPDIGGSKWQSSLASSSGNSTGTAAPSTKSIIAKTTLRKVSLDDALSSCGPYSKVRINNSKDANHTPKVVDEIVATALSCVGMEDDGPIGCYNVLNNNCEHFAYYCRYGKKLSSVQVDEFMDKVKIVVATAAAVAIGIAAYCNPVTAGAITTMFVALNR